MNKNPLRVVGRTNELSVSGMCKTPSCHFKWPRTDDTQAESSQQYYLKHWYEFTTHKLRRYGLPLRFRLPVRHGIQPYCIQQNQASKQHAQQQPFFAFFCVLFVFPAGSVAGESAALALSGTDADLAPIEPPYATMEPVGGKPLLVLPYCDNHGY